METVPLEKGYVHLMDDRIVIEGDDAVKRKNKNLLFYGFLLLLFSGYLYTSYEQYRNNPHTFNMFVSVIKILLFLALILPGAVEKLILSSTINEILYTQIRKHEPAGTFFKWEQAIKLYLDNRITRSLRFEGEDMARFRFQLDQKLKNINSLSPIR